MSDNRREYLVDTTVSRSNTTERLHEYQKRGVQKVQVIAYIDSRTTDICRSMNNRIFEIGPAAESLRSQESLVQDGNFWKSNKYFYQTGTEKMSKPWLPPYHYNCRTRIVPYVEPVDPSEQMLDRFANLERVEERQMQATRDRAVKFEFASKQRLLEHVIKHGHEYGTDDPKVYMRKLREIVADPSSNAALGIYKANKCLTLYLWSSEPRDFGGVTKYDLVIINLDRNHDLTLYPATKDWIENSIGNEENLKAMIIKDEIISKGDKKMITSHDVKCYEDILDYLEWGDDTAGYSAGGRMWFEREWDSIAPELKERILAVDRIVLERHVDAYDVERYKEYIATIRRRLEIEEGKR
jgi:hypothetical protein